MALLYNDDNRFYVSHKVGGSTSYSEHPKIGK